MSPHEPEGHSSRRGLLAPLGIFLIVSGIVVILVAAFANPVVAAAGPFLIASGIGLVVASEYREEADMEYSRWWGLRLKTRKGTASDEDDHAAQARSPRERAERPSLEVIEGKSQAGGPRNRDPTRRASACRLAQALSRRSDGSG